MTNLIRNADGQEFAIDENLTAALKEAGFKPAKAKLAALVDGSVSEYLGFVRIVPPFEFPKAPEVADEPAPEVPAAHPRMFPTIAGLTPPPVVLTAEPAKAASGRSKRVITSVAPKGKVKPVRKATKIANGLEMLLGGAELAALTGAGLSDDIVDFVMRRVTKRGYGISLVDGIVKLVLPENVTAIVYGNSAAD